MKTPWLILVILATGVVAGVGYSDEREIGGLKSKAIFAGNLDTGEVILARDADEVRPVASLSKMFAAYTLIRECRPSFASLHEMTKDNRLAAKGGDKATKLTTGWSYSLRDLLHAALMRSDNRALPALAEACDMTPQELGMRMTIRAQTMGLAKTAFAEPTGLSPQNVSTAREMFALLREALRDPLMREVMTTKIHTIVGYKNGRSRSVEIRNTDRLLMNDEVEVIGGKTGYTDLARYCLAIGVDLPLGDTLVSARKSIGMVLLGAEGKLTRFADVKRLVKWMSERIKLASSGPAMTAPQTAQREPSAQQDIPGH